MIKNIIASLCLLISLTISAQQGTSSPYSFYGVGDLKFKGTVENRSMGGISVFPDSIHMNLQNPAHFASLKLTNYALGGTSSSIKSASEDFDEKARRSSIDYIAAAFPLKKLGFGFGAIPYTSVGYKIQETNFNTVNPKIIDSISKYDGIGGVNKVFLGFGYQLTKKINIGMDIQYNFGNIETNGLKYKSDVQYGTKEYNRSNIRGYNLDFGITYQTPLNQKLNFYTSLAYTPESELEIRNERNVQIIQLLSQGVQIPVENNAITVSDKIIKLPSKITFGTGVGQAKKWMLGGEISYIENSVLSNRFDDIQDGTFENSMRYSLGGYFIPKYNSFRNYASKVVYRGGLRMENSGLVINSKSIEDYAFTMGAGLPLGSLFSNLNLGLEIGRRGTTYGHLIREDYVNFSIGFSLNDKWFVKRTID